MANYKLFNQQISFSDSSERFYDMQYRAWNAMSYASNEFNVWYDKCGDILTVLKGYEDKACDLVIKYSNKPLFNELTQYEIYDISEDSYDDKCIDFSELSDALDTIADKYNAIVEEQAAEEAYRAERKANRSRVVGGGFGVGGALKGMATAGAMNAVSGAGHGIVNAIGNAGSALATASSKRALYDSDATREILRDGIRSDILSCFNSHIHLINKRLSSHIISSFDSDKASALFENAKKVSEKQQELLIESFKNCPWNEELLEFIFIQYKSERKNVWDTAKRFHVDLSDIVEQAFAKSYTGIAKTSEEEAQKVKADILAQMKEFGISSSKTLTNIEIDGLNRIIKNYDNAPDEKRKEIFDAFETYDALPKNKTKVVHDNGIWELAKKYSVKFSQDELDEILDRYYTEEAKNSEEVALKVRVKMRSIMKTLGFSESATLDELENDCLKRVCGNLLEADEDTCNKLTEKVSKFEATEKNRKIYINKIQARKEAIWSKEDGEIFDNVFLGTDITNEDERKKSIDFIKQKGRTSSSGRYISALTGCTAENIKMARLFQKSFIKYMMYGGYALIGLGILLLFLGNGLLISVGVAAIGTSALIYYNKLKKIWNRLTLNGTMVHKQICITGIEQRNQTVLTKEQQEAEIEKTAKFYSDLQKVLDEEKNSNKK